MSEGGIQTRRLFLALWPDDAVRTRLAALARQHTRHPVQAANLHMTLHFLGACTPEQQQCYIKVISGIKFQSFVLKLDYIGAWPRSRIQWLGISETSPALGELVGALAGALTGCDYRPDERRFVPHITLSRQARNPRIRAGLVPVVWPVDAFVLAESLRIDGQVYYRVLERWRSQD